MRRILSAAVAAALVTVPSLARAQAQPAAGVRIAFIRSQAVVEQAPGRTDAEAAFRAYIEVVRDQLGKMRDTLEKLVAEYQKTEPSLTAAARTSRQTILRGKQEELQQKQQQFEEQARLKQVELMQPITDLVIRRSTTCARRRDTR